MKFEFADLSTEFFVLRSPLFSLDLLRDNSLEKIKRLSREPLVRAALSLASSELLRAVDAGDPDSVAPLTRYLIRMSARCTPYGLFAGVSTGEMSTETRLELQPIGHHRYAARPDAEWMDSITSTLLDQLLSQSANITVFPNSSIYRLGDRYRYVETGSDDGRRTYELSSVESTPAIERVLSKASHGAQVRSLCKALVRMKASRADATAYLHELIRSGFLVPGLCPPMTGILPLDWINRELRLHRGASGARRSLRTARRKLADLQKMDLAKGPPELASVSATLSEIAPCPTKNPFQLDLLKQAKQLTLGPSVLKAAAQGVLVLHRIFSGTESDPLSQFRQEFWARWEDREVPLAWVFDPEFGIRLNAIPAASVTPARHLDWLQGIWETALQSGSREIQLTPEAVRKQFRAADRPLPASFASILSLAARSQEELDHGNFMVVLAESSGPSASRVLGRFCHSDPLLTRALSRHLRSEESMDPGAIFAEIVHEPVERHANFILRPHLRQYELPLIQKSGASMKYQLKIDDLRVSIRNGTFVIRSEKHRKRVIPRVSTAQTYLRSDFSLYQFLGLLQGQEVDRNLAWNWLGLERASYYPRVTYGQVVLSLERWVLRGETRDSLLKERDAAARYRLFLALAKKLRMPRWLCWHDRDGRLPFDSSDPLSVESLLGTAAADSAIVISEMYPTPDLLVCTSEEGRYCSEIVIPWIYKSKARADTTFIPKPLTRSDDVKLPGSDWLYLKIYVGEASANQVLILVDDIVRRLSRQGRLALRWFFIRYTDSEFQLRVRIQGKPNDLLQRVLPEFHRRLTQEVRRQRVKKFSVETYEPETGRYGGARAMRCVEDIFVADSAAAIQIVRACERGAISPASADQLAEINADRFIRDFGFSDRDALSFLRDQCERFLKHAGAQPRSLERRSDRERAEYDSLGQSLDLITGERSRELKRPIRSLLKEVPDRASLHAIVMSLLHLQLNRTRGLLASHEELNVIQRLIRQREIRIHSKRR